MAELRTAVFLFTDMEGSTRLWEADEGSMRLVLARHDELLRQAVERHGGTVFATGGDGLAAVFSSVVAAVSAALDAQRSFAVEDWAAPGDIAVRMGIHLGEAEVRGGDWFGSTLNRAARVMSIAHGGQVVVTNAVADAVRHLLPEGASLLDLGVHHLRDVSRSERLWQLVGEGLRSSFPPLRSMGGPAIGLPVYLTSFVGRDDVSTLVELVSTARLVTLTGPGGVGKTRLAAELCAHMVGVCDDGVWFVELASLVEPSGLDDAVATALGLAAAASRRDAILDAIGRREVLLVLDNAEHVLESVRDLVSAAVNHCPSLLIVVTSREPLGVDGERVWPVQSLPLEAAIELFTARARAANPNAVLSDSVMAQICSRLDRIPMAIELAAARVRSLSLGEVGAHINERFDLLTAGRRGALERHRTMPRDIRLVVPTP